MGVKRGDILLVDFDPGSPGETAKVRPAILVTNDMANLYSPVLVVVPLTSTKLFSLRPTPLPNEPPRG